MLKATYKDSIDGKTAIVLGLSKRNLELLSMDHPIMFDGSDINQPDFKFIILYGDTEMDIVKTLNKAGIKTPETAR